MIKHIESGIGGRGLRNDYPAYVAGLSEKLGLNTSVCTKNDGSIKVVAEGEEESLKQFAGKLKNGGFFSSVENFYVKWS